MFGNIGFSEMMMILVVGLLVIGPKKLPELARTLGKSLNEFRRMSLDIKTSLTTELEQEQTTRTQTPVTPRPAPMPSAAEPVGEEAAATAAALHATQPEPVAPTSQPVISNRELAPLAKPLSPPPAPRPVMAEGAIARGSLTSAPSASASSPAPVGSEGAAGEAAAVPVSPEVPVSSEGVAKSSDSSGIPV
ncbi:MAG: Sec-independent protein translocase protein TatB [Myxococcota bacterium]